MDSGRFDSLVKSLAKGANRRSVLKGMLGLGGAAAVGSTLLDSGADAARRPTPTPKPPACPPHQYWNGAKCVCSTGDTCGPECCLIGSECCDNACCFGHCYGEELCCSYDDWCAATNECCTGDAVCCGEEGCVVIDDGDCGCGVDCPDGFDCCGGQCCASGYCAGTTCCALGACNGECIESEELRCCGGATIYDPAEDLCCNGWVTEKAGAVCCDGVIYPGICCQNDDCGSCSTCTDHRCSQPAC